MGEILSAEEVQRCNSWTAERSEMWRRLDALFRSHEALRADRDRLASLVDVTRKHRQWAERSKDAAEARLAEVEAEREAARSNVAHWSAEWSTRLRAAEARLAEVEQALRFYADPANHAWPSPDQAWSNVDADNGDIARAVLDKGEPK